jgi:hypothetical protein
LTDDIVGRMERLRRDNIRAVAAALESRAVQRGLWRRTHPPRILRFGRLSLVWHPRKSQGGHTTVHGDVDSQLVALLKGIECGYAKAQRDRG